MERKKLYYTADEIKPNLYTMGKELMTMDNVEYKGLYHSYSTGEIYTQSTWNFKTSKPLIQWESQLNQLPQSTIYKKLKPNVIVTYDSVSNSSVTITNTDIKNGFVTRYFITRYDSDTIQEINNISYTKTIDIILFNKLSIQWYITGPKQDRTSGIVTIAGVRSKNIQQITNANIKMPGIIKHLTNPLEYYTDVDFITPTDINGLDS